MAVFALAMVAANTTGALGRDLTVVELFTSQGCSSCPPADAFLGELASREDVLALSFHVDYWDYIGWRDPFASAANTQRQRVYAQRFGLGYVYTPQMVVQGMAQMTGSNRPAVLNGIAQARTMPRVPVEIRSTDGGATVMIGGSDRAEPSSVWSVVFDRGHETSIKRGENRGRTLKYAHVVRDLKRVGEWTGEPMELSLPIGEMVADGRDACAIIVQSDMTGRIFGAALLALDDTAAPNSPAMAGAPR